MPSLAALSTPKHQANRGFAEFERFPELVDQVALVRKVYGLGAVAEKNKSRWAHRRLRRIIKLEAASPDHGRLMSL